MSRSDSREPAWEIKLERYHEVGVQELVRFDADAPPGGAIRVWDRFDGDLVERTVEGDQTPCLVLGLHWCVAPVDEYLRALRLKDSEGSLLLLPVEEQAGRAERERARADAAERRLAELEAELALRAR